jgi:hypothetical protein
MRFTHTQPTKAHELPEELSARRECAVCGAHAINPCASECGVCGSRDLQPLEYTGVEQRPGYRLNVGRELVTDRELA